MNLQSEGALFDWVAQQGVDRQRFEEVFRSDAVTARMTESRALTDAFHIESTPSVAVDGRYLTSSGMTGGVGAAHGGCRRTDRMVARRAARAAMTLRVVITGASSGIGAALAHEYARRGATLGLIARRAEALQELLRELPCPVAIYPADVRDAAAVSAAARDFQARHRRRGHRHRQCRA